MFYTNGMELQTHQLLLSQFQRVYDNVCDKYLEKGDAQPDNLVATLSDDRILSAFTKKVFKSGFVWRVVENKWSNFEELFFDFDLTKVLMMPEEMQERKAADARIIRTNSSKLSCAIL